MEALWQFVPWFAAMGLLVLGSGFFSSSEAAIFSLGSRDLRLLRRGGHPQRAAAALLADSDRLLTAVLFWNLLLNILYFALAAIVALELERERPALSGAVAAGSLLAIIVFGEMLPKSLAVLAPRQLAALVALPLAGLVRAVAPVLPVFHTANELSRRVLWPQFQAEPHLRVGDLERAVELSRADAAVLKQEQMVLTGMVSLSETRVDEMMRPRIQFLTFRPPVSPSDLKGQVLRSGYLLVTEAESDEVAGAIPLRSLADLPEERLEERAEEVVYVPWSSTVAAALEALRQRNLKVAVVVNELGETIGVLTIDDILDTLFTPAPSRSERLLMRRPIRLVRPGVWQVTGMTGVRRLVRYFDVPRPPSKSVTVAGVVQEVLERLPEQGDSCRWGPFAFKVVDTFERGQLLLEVTLAESRDEGGRN